MTRAAEQADWRRRRQVRKATEAAKRATGRVTGWRGFVHHWLPGLMDARGGWRAFHRDVRRYYAPILPAGLWPPARAGALPAPAAPVKRRAAKKPAAPPAGQAIPMPKGGYRMDDPRVFLALQAMVEAELRRMLQLAEAEGFRVPGKVYPPAAAAPPRRARAAPQPAAAAPSEKPAVPAPAARQSKPTPKLDGDVPVQSHTRTTPSGRPTPVTRHTRDKPQT